MMKSPRGGDAVDDIRQRLTAHRLQGDSRGCFAQHLMRLRTTGGDVGGEDDIGHLQDRMIGWNRLGIEDIERGTGEMT